jgi:uncharacterized membrane protein YdbT with pleckstrin-like domain
MRSQRFPLSILGDDEDLVLDLRPHWIGLVVPTTQSLAIFLVVLMVFLFTPFSWSWIFILVLLGGLAVFAFWPLRRFVGWATSHFILTTDRVMQRAGLIARHSQEISLERISDVRFQETVGERVIGAGDLIIESAGALGPISFEDVRNPERVQKRIFEMKEANAVRTKESERRASVPRWLPASVADELIKLEKLRRAHVISDAEFSSLKERLLERV